MSAKTELELTWIGKESRPRLELHFDAQDEIERQRDGLIGAIEAKLTQNVSSRV